MLSSIAPVRADELVSAPVMFIPRPQTPNLDRYAELPSDEGVIDTDDGVIVGYKNDDGYFFGGKLGEDGGFGFSGGKTDDLGVYFPYAHPDKPEFTGGFDIGPFDFGGSYDTNTGEWTGEVGVSVTENIDVSYRENSDGSRYIDLTGTWR